MESLGLLPIIHMMGSSGYQLAQVKGVNGAFPNNSDAQLDLLVTTFSSAPDLCLIHMLRTKTYPIGSPSNDFYKYFAHGWVAILNDSSDTLCCDISFMSSNNNVNEPMPDGIKYTVKDTWLRLEGTALYTCRVYAKYTRDLSMMVYAFKKL